MLVGVSGSRGWPGSDRLGAAYCMETLGLDDLICMMRWEVQGSSTSPWLWYPETVKWGEILLSGKTTCSQGHGRLSPNLCLAFAEVPGSAPPWEFKTSLCVTLTQESIFLLFFSDHGTSAHEWAGIYICRLGCSLELAWILRYKLHLWVCPAPGPVLFIVWGWASQRIRSGGPGESGQGLFKGSVFPLFFTHSHWFQLFWKRAMAHRYECEAWVSCPWPCLPPGHRV